MDISILTSAYNYGWCIEDCIKSVLSQKTSYSYEHIICLDESGDDTLEICKKYSHLVLDYSLDKRGQVKSLNEGLKKAKGKYIGWINADDFYSNFDVFEKMIKILDAYPELCLVCGGYSLAYKNGRIKETRLDPLKQFKVNAHDFRCFVAFMWQPTVFMQKDKILEVGGFCEEINYVFDKELFLKLCCRWKHGYLPEDIATWRDHENCMSHEKDIEGKNLALREAQRIIKHSYDNDWKNLYGYMNKKYI